ncbi:MAG: hypothetical protein J0J05_07005 [Microbacterium sp.]|uniref:hypothetical protein n=1 Tax=Microbacterium sp. TaxID=51671 RepID=UPI001AC96FF3|nr:hypothetical protein [Microbacterium sp.]MBN9153713.1 hypothetical protein [Microbacterium sp.]
MKTTEDPTASARPSHRRSVRARVAAAVAVAVLGALAAVGVAAPAGAAGVQVTANPTTIAVGSTTTITATGLGGLEKAGFGLGDNSAGTFTESKGTSYDAPVTDGTATATFLAAKAGTVTIAVGDGETVLGTVQVTVDGNAPTVVDVQASPGSISTGATSTITVTGLGGLQQASFGLGDTSAGTFTENGGTTYEAPVTGGRATATFSAAAAGTVTISVGDGENVLGTTTVTVTAASPTPTPTPTPTPSPSPAPADGGLSTVAIIWIVAIVLVLIAAAAITTALVVRARNRSAADAAAGGPHDDRPGPSV